MVGNGNQILRYIFNQLFFSFQRGFTIVGQTDAVSYPEYMRIHCHSRFVVDDRRDYVRCFTAYPWQFLELVDIGRHFAAKHCGYIRISLPA